MPLTRLAAMAALLLAPLPALAQQVFPADVIVQDHLCVGPDCLTSENFANDRLRLKSETPHIRFFDTSSTTGGAPYVDWAIRINDNAVGGENYFAVENASQGNAPFRVDHGARENALRVTANSRIGVGTMLPQEVLHLMNSENAPVAIRMQHYQSEIFRQTFDLVSYFTGFYLHDDKWNTTPLFVQPNTPTYSLMLANTGRIGLGVFAPEVGLHMTRSDGTGAILVEETSAGTLGQLTLRNNGITYFTLEDTSRSVADYSGRKWNFQNQAGEFRVTTPPGGTGEIEMRMTPQGDMHIKGNLYTGTGGASTTCAAGCDRVFDPDYLLPTISQQMAAIRAAGHLPAVGPTDEAGPFNLSAMTGGMLNELEKAYLYIGELDARNRSLAEEVAALRDKVDAMAGR